MYKNQIAELIANTINSADFSAETVLSLMIPPKDITLGDICMPCFKLSKIFRKPPMAIAEDLAAKIQKPEYVDSITAVAGYLNFKYNAEFLAKKTLTAILEKGENYGKSDIGKDKTICIDYSSVNIAKPFHIGHLSATAIGAALYRIYKELGYNVVGINHLGDWGTQFGKMIVAYKLWGNEDTFKGGVRSLHALYVRFHKEAENDESLNDQARYWFKQIELGEPEAMDLFNKFKKVTLDEVCVLYDRLGVTFDSYNGESFYNDKMGEVLDILNEKGLLKDSQGAKVVELGDNMPPCLLVKSDGASLYATRDLAAALYRARTYHFSKCLYVVAYQQDLHFKQWFKVAEKMGFDWAKDLEHVAFGMVSLAEGSMSSRNGTVVYLEDVINKAVEKAYDIIVEKNANIENKQDIAEKIGVGSVVFSVLTNNRIKDIVFNYDKVLTFEGETCPYVQYTYVRCNSILEKATIGDNVDFSVLCDDTSKELLRYLSNYPNTLIDATEKNEPYLVTRCVLNICQLFNKFYIDNRIIDAPEEIKNARLILTKAVKTVIKNGFRLLGIQMPEKM